MENNKLDQKTLRRVTSVYAVIVILVNFVGYMMATSVDMPTIKNNDYDVWVQFMTAHRAIVNMLSVMSFVIPFIMIARYRRVMLKKNNDKIINIPFVYAALGSVGWLLSFLMQFTCLLVVKMKYHTHIFEIVMVSFLNIIQECICIFTLGFLIMNFIHRKKVLPKLYSDGKLSRIKVVMNPSVRFLVVVFYLFVFFQCSLCRQLWFQSCRLLVLW